MKYLIYTLLLFLSAFSVKATPLYIQQVKLSSVNEKKLQEALKQIKEHSEVSLKDNLFVSPFHKQTKSESTDKQSFCNVCHKKQPHSLDKRKRSFLNMHTRYVSCETCHFIPKNTQLKYKWLNFNSDSNKIPAKRITPFYNNEAVLTFSDNKFAEQVKENWANENQDKKTTIEKAKLKLRLHTPLNAEGPECLDCHNNKNQLLDLESLKFSRKDIKKLQQHAIPRFFSRFSKEDQSLRMTDLLQ